MFFYMLYLGTFYTLCGSYNAMYRFIQEAGCIRKTEKSSLNTETDKEQGRVP